MMMANNNSATAFLIFFFTFNFGYANNKMWGITLKSEANLSSNLMTMLKQNFEGKNISVNEFSGTRTELDCPYNRTIEGEDTKRYSRNKVLGITLRHILLWQTFLYQKERKYRDDSTYLVVFEDDADCAFANCGELTLDEIRCGMN